MQYFYGCSIKAAHMAKRFGIGFYSPMNMHEIVVLPIIDGESNEPKYVHPFYHEQFEPKDGDVGLLNDGRALVWCDKAKVWWLVKDKGQKAFINTKPIRIIMRNGEEFFMPDVI